MCHVVKSTLGSPASRGGGLTSSVFDCPNYLLTFCIHLFLVGLVGWVVVSCAARHVEVREQPVGVGFLGVNRVKLVQTQTVQMGNNNLSKPPCQPW